jgi:thioredoxin reductase (NADPH)
MEEGIFLTRFATKVTVVHRRDKLRASSILETRARQNPKMEFIWNTEIGEISGDGAVQRVILKNVESDNGATMKTDGVFIFIGHSPNTELFRGHLDLDEAGYIKVNQHMETSVSGVFAAGEVADPYFRQVITSAGMGAAAAIQATRFLEADSE